jgi:uncharacterized repeat protein (TIGR03803 family)
MLKYGWSRNRIIIGLLALTSVSLVGILPAWATSESTLWTFAGSKTDGYEPFASLLRDKAGNLYGTTIHGGAYLGPGTLGDGTVFKLTPPVTTGGTWTEALLWSFGNGGLRGDGTSPTGSVIMDGNGNLYGTTGDGGPTPSGHPGSGTVFELLPPAVSGGNWTEAILHTFTGGRDGDTPVAGLTMDKRGNLYGTASAGGVYKFGTVFELSPPATAGGAWAKRTLWSFGNGTDGSQPSGTLLRDTAGNLYGTTAGGGTYGEGTVFELIKPTTAGGDWTESILWDFGNSTDAAGPTGSLAIDKIGNLYGTTVNGGSLGKGAGVELSPPAVSGGTWTEAVLWDFGNGSDGENPAGGVTIDSHGNLYGPTYNNGTLTGGTVFELQPPASSGGSWTESVLWTFDASLQGGVILDPQGHLYGTTSSGSGTVFELTNIGG